jgi:hypothetical protein
MSQKKTDYAVGYGKPPEHSRFQAGQSGNPKGRPKGSLNLATAVNRALREKVVVVENGRRKSITKLDAAVTQMVNRAVKGDPKAMQQMLSLGPLVGIEPAAGTPALDANDAAVMAGLAQRLGITPSKKPSSDE